jgi:hypothetical protein
VDVECVGCCFWKGGGTCVYVCVIFGSSCLRCIARLVLLMLLGFTVHVTYSRGTLLSSLWINRKKQNKRKRAESTSLMCSLYNSLHDDVGCRLARQLARRRMRWWSERVVVHAARLRKEKDECLFIAHTKRRRTSASHFCPCVCLCSSRMSVLVVMQMEGGNTQASLPSLFFFKQH